MPGTPEQHMALKQQKAGRHIPWCYWSHVEIRGVCTVGMVSVFASVAASMLLRNLMLKCGCKTSILFVCCYYSPVTAKGCFLKQNDRLHQVYFSKSGLFCNKFDRS